MSSQSGSELVEYDSECYEVECIRDMKIVRGKKFYFIKWVGWEEQHNTWEPIENLQTVLALVKQFQKEFQQKSGTKKDNEKTIASKQAQSSEGLKKTKQIQKQKKKKKNQQESQHSQSQSQIVEAVQIKEKKSKKDDKTQSKKLTNNKNKNNQIPVEKQRQSIKDKQKQSDKFKNIRQQKEREKEKQKPKQVISNKRNEPVSSSLNNSRSAQASASASLTKQPSKTASQTFNNPNDIVQISRINYHIMIPPQLPHLPAKLFYNVDRRNKITKKPLAVIDVPSDELVHKYPQIIVSYLENFVKQVEYYSYQKKEWENKQNLQNQVQNSNGKNLLLQAKK